MKARNPLLTLLAVMGVAACTTLTEELPQQPEAPVQAPPPVIIVNPGPIPDVPHANPTPAPAPDPGGGGAPPPAPPPPPAQSQGCGLPPGNGPGTDCPRQSPSFLPAVESALTQLIAEEPGVFDKSEIQGCGTCYKVVKVQRYITRMPELMEQRGLCAMYDGEELAVKNSNSFNDQYDILTSGMYIRRDQGSYRSTCYPAWF
jgi:hypothetical protein